MERNALELKGDAPLQNVSEDEFGLGQIVGQLAGTLALRVRSSGYTLGIEGSWGSGKSTLVNFIADELRVREGQRIIRFEPWLIGERTALLGAFFALFAAQIDELENSSVYGSSFTRWKRKRATQKLSGNIRKYGEYLTALSLPAAAVASSDPTFIAAAAAVGLKTLGAISRFFGSSVSLDALRGQITMGLEELRKEYPTLRFTVIIDDIDRLEPAEAVEILRMVQKVADFPLTTYLVCFDGDVLANQVKQVLGVSDGRLYFEKIFQDVFHVPPQEPFALRRHLKGKLELACPQQMLEASQERSTQYRAHLLFDVWVGVFVKTPRDVARLVDAIVFSWPALPEGSDFIDFVWLQLIKQKSAALFGWTREYLQNVGAYRDGGRAGDLEPKTAAQSLSRIMTELGWADRAYRSGIDHFLPGVASFALSEENQRVFDFGSQDLAEFENGHRLGSPSHWRAYFAFDVPSYALKEADLARFRESVRKGAADCSVVLKDLFERPHERNGHFLDLLLDKIIDLPEGAFSQEEARAIAAGFAETMDTFAKLSDERKSRGYSEIWRKASQIMQKARPDNFLELIPKGRSLNWLANVLRDQGFAHGLPERARTYEENQWLDQDQLKDAIEAIIWRFRCGGMRSLFKLPIPSDALFCWQQLGPKDEAMAYFHDATETDLAFLQGLEALRGWSNSSATGISFPLPERYVQLFVPTDEAKARLLRLVERKGTSKKAKELIEAWTSGSS